MQESGVVPPLRGIIPRPPGPSLGSAFPLWRFQLVNRWRPRTIWFLSLHDHFQVSLFLRDLQHRLEPTGLVILDANLWFDGGRGVPTPYHTEIWWLAPLVNRLVQVWIPLACEGSQEEIARSMLRVAAEPLAEDWTCAPGQEHTSHLYTGQTRALPFENRYGCPVEDLPGALGGADLQVGDVLYFDGAYPHYSMASKARRVGLALRLVRGEPTYNGYFDEPRPLDGKTPAEATRQLFQRLLRGFAPGEQISREHFLGRFEKMPLRWRLAWKLKSYLLLYDGCHKLHPSLARYSEVIAERLTEAP